jgi:hypothetical protein
LFIGEFTKATVTSSSVPFSVGYRITWIVMSFKTASRERSPLRRKSLLDLPLDLLLHVYEAYVKPDSGSDEAAPCRCITKLYHEEETHSPCRSWPLERVNRATRVTFRQFLANRSWRLEIVKESGVVRTDLPCPRSWKSVPPSRLSLSFHSFYHLSALRRIWTTLATLCQRLHAVPALRSLKIEIDTALPRTCEPFNIDLIELERAPLIITILLQPFTILHCISAARIDVLPGTVRRSILQDNPVVNDFLLVVREHLSDETCTLHHEPWQMMRLCNRLDDCEEFWRLWKDPIASCSMIARCW